MRTIAALIYPEFETLDLFGPIQMFGSLKGQFNIKIVAEKTGYVTSRHGQRIAVDHCFDDDQSYDLLVIPGGPGTWAEIDNPVLLNWLIRKAAKADIVTSVCTGAALLAKAGLLENKSATTNKLNFDWVTQFGQNIAWQGRARWVQDGGIFTSSGVSAGMDMSLAVIEHLIGANAANGAAIHSEYERQIDPDNDPFAIHYKTYAAPSGSPPQTT